jgi:uncharacterized membrane protein SpoIIM required for sporulation
MERWRFLALEGVRWSRTLARPRSLQQVEQFTSAYRQAATELARVRAFSPDKRLAEFIEQAVATAHFAVYRRNRTSAAAILAGAVFGFPAVVRRHWRYHLLALVLLLVPAVIAYLAVVYYPDTYYLFVDKGLAAGRDPSASAEFLADGLGPQDTSASTDIFFSQFLFTHNTRVAFICFAWGILLGLPTIYILVKTGLMLGGFTGLFVSKGLGIPYFAWILPHGVPEIGAIILCAGAGMLMGHRVLNPGDKSRADALRQAAADASVTALGCVPLLLVAGLIEGIFRQSHADTGLRYALFLFMLATISLWLLLARAKARRDWVTE